MTNMGISWLNYRENQRSNLAKEAETNRSNLADEAIRRTGNLITEAHYLRSDANTAEGNRIKLLQQEIDKDKLTVEINKLKEQISHNNSQERNDFIRSVMSADGVGDYALLAAVAAADPDLQNMIYGLNAKDRAEIAQGFNAAKNAVGGSKLGRFAINFAKEYTPN